MSLFELLMILSTVIYIFTLGPKRNWAYLIAACIMGPTVWFFELYTWLIFPRLKRLEKEHEQMRTGLVLVGCLALAVPVVAAARYFTGNIPLW